METVNRTEPHVAFTDNGRYRYTDENGVDVYGPDREVMCGAWRDGGTVLCDPCEKEAGERYPQGWQSYPGDVCPHGTYTGGSGIDWMCHYCESGE